MVASIERVRLDFHHQIGVHCASTGMRDILEYYGLKLSEELCLGLGCGLNFVYWRAPNVPYYLVIGRGSQIEVDLCEFLGIQIDVIKSEDQADTWNPLKSCLDRNMPVLVDVDMSYLGYLRQRIQLIENMRFGGHKVVVTGYDLGEGTVQLSDYAWHSFQTVTQECLAMARGSVVGPTLPENTMYVVHPFRQTIPLRVALRNAIRVNMHRMLHSWDRAVGLPGVEKLAREVTRWPRVMNAETLRMNAFVTYMMLEAVGTGGGAFRRLYSRFLREAEEIMGLPDLRPWAVEYAEIAKLWAQLARMFKSSADLEPGGIFAGDGVAQELLNELARRERAACEQVHRVVCATS